MAIDGIASTAVSTPQAQPKRRLCTLKKRATRISIHFFLFSTLKALYFDLQSLIVVGLQLSIFGKTMPYINR
jgi:hypothetical protein